MDIEFNRAEDTFSKAIPFKVYRIANSNVTGTTEHAHDYMQIWYVQKGCCEHYTNENCHLLVRGNLFVLPPFAAHRVKVIPGEEIEIIGCEFLTDFIGHHESLPDRASGLLILRFWSLSSY